MIPVSRFQFNRSVPATSVVIFTDLDGTLLDHDSYSFDAAKPALDELRRRGIPLVIVTSKTRAEVSRLREEIGVAGDDIVENGARSRDYEWLCRELNEASSATGVRIRGFHQMTAEEISRVAGLPVETARLAARRENSEPFEIADADNASALLSELERRGLRWTRGGRFHHVFEHGGKGEAVEETMRRYPGAASVGLGDAPNDIGFLQNVGYAVIVRSANLERMREALPFARITSQPGPLGWNEAIVEFFSDRGAFPDPH